MIALVCWLGFSALLSFVAVISYARDHDGAGLGGALLAFFGHSASFVFLLMRAKP